MALLICFRVSKDHADFKQTLNKKNRKKKERLYFVKQTGMIFSSILIVILGKQ